MSTAEQKQKAVREGKAEIPFSESEGVFYNKVQEFNRDTSILVIKQFIKKYRQEKEEQAAKKAEKAAAAEKRRQERLAKQGGGEHKAAPVAETKAPAEAPYVFEGVRILEALSATGLRSIRYWKEIGGGDGSVRSILVNDISAEAVEAIKKNIAHNGLTTEQLVPNQEDAAMCMYRNRNAYEVVDLDPYGTASPFLDSAVQSVMDGGLLIVTCTDKAVLAGNHTETCYAKYGSMSLHCTYNAEQAVRIVLHAIDSAAVRYKRYIVPLVSLSVDFYVRVFVRVFESAEQVKQSAGKQGYVHQCTGCESFHIQRMCKVIEQGRSVRFTPGTAVVDKHCDQCGSVFKLGGPMWMDPLHDPEFVAECVKYVEEHAADFGTSKRIRGVLTTCAEELPNCFYYDPSKLTKIIKTSRVPKNVELRSALLNAGYRVSQTHCLPTGIKTDAPNDVMFDILRGHAKLFPPLNPLPEGSAGANILAKEAKLQADFKFVDAAKLDSGVAKFLPNPEENWGPKARAKKRKEPEGEGKEGEGERPAAKVKESRRAKRQKIKVDQPCMAWVHKGTCKHGDTCRFVHANPAAAAGGDTAGAASTAEPATAAAGTEAAKMDESSG